MTQSRRILGIDPGSRLTGFGVLDYVEETPRYVTSGAIRTLDGTFPERLKSIYKAVGEIVAESLPIPAPIAEIDTVCVPSTKLSVTPETLNVPAKSPARMVIDPVTVVERQIQPRAHPDLEHPPGRERHDPLPDLTDTLAAARRLDQTRQHVLGIPTHGITLR